MEYLGLVWTEILIVLVNLGQAIWCRTRLGDAVAWVHFVEYSQYLINIIQNTDSGYSTNCLIHIHAKVFVNLALDH